METLRRPMVALMIWPDEGMWKRVFSGEKRITIRKGFRDYKVGDTLMLGCHIRNCAAVTKVTEVVHCYLSRVTKEEYQDDGFSSQGEMLAGLQVYNSDLTLDSEVTVIRWGELLLN